MCQIIYDYVRNTIGIIMTGVYITKDVIIPEEELVFSFSRSSGAGGQHVNKKSTRVTLRWALGNSSALTEDQKKRVIEKLTSRLTQEHELIIHASSFRSQYKNKKAAQNILIEMIKNALQVPKRRVKINIAHQTKESRLKHKKHRSGIKKLRSKKNIIE